MLKENGNGKGLMDNHALCMTQLVYVLFGKMHDFVGKTFGQHQLCLRVEEELYINWSLRYKRLHVPH